VQKTLDEHQVHTVISALSLVTQEQSDAQITLIRGAAASHVKRFAPSEFGIPYTQKSDSPAFSVDLTAADKHLQFELDRAHT
jgi:hypothetical protein